MVLLNSNTQVSIPGHNITSNDGTMVVPQVDWPGTALLYRLYLAEDCLFKFRYYGLEFFPAIDVLAPHP
jgi:hypothetical protein